MGPIDATLPAPSTSETLPSGSGFGFASPGWGLFR